MKSAAIVPHAKFEEFVLKAPPRAPSVPGPRLILPTVKLLVEGLKLIADDISAAWLPDEDDATNNG